MAAVFIERIKSSSGRSNQGSSVFEEFIAPSSFYFKICRQRSHVLRWLGGPKRPQRRGLSYLWNDLNAARSGPQAHGRIMTTFLPSIVKMRL